MLEIDTTMSKNSDNILFENSDNVTKKTSAFVWIFYSVSHKREIKQW